MCCGLIFFQIFFYRVGFKLIHLSLESDSVNYQCNKYCVTRKHCGGGDCGWLWGSGHCHFYGCRKKQAVRGSSSDLGYMYMIRGSRKKFRGWGWEWESVPDKPPPPPPSLLDPSMYIMSGAVNFTFFNTILHVYKQ